MVLTVDSVAISVWIPPAAVRIRMLHLNGCATDIPTHVVYV